MAALWARYIAVLNRRPLATQMAQSTVLMGLGDVIAQQLVEKTEKHDTKRTLQFMGLGCFFVVRDYFKL